MNAFSSGCNASRDSAVPYLAIELRPGDGQLLTGRERLHVESVTGTFTTQCGPAMVARPHAVAA
jgi:hypothetical protein